MWFVMGFIRFCAYAMSMGFLGGMLTFAGMFLISLCVSPETGGTLGMLMMVIFPMGILAGMVCGATIGLCGGFGQWADIAAVLISVIGVPVLAWLTGAI